MSLYKEFDVLFPYIQSVRKLKNYLSFDILFPDTWKLPKKYINEEQVIQNEKSITGQKSFSFVCEFTEEKVDEVIWGIKNIISYNKEREEKEKLFESKVSELKTIFEKTNLNNLQELKFEIKEKIKLEYDEETTEPTRGDARMVEE